MRNLRRLHSLPVLRQKSNKLGPFSEAFSDLKFSEPWTPRFIAYPVALPEVILAFAQEIGAPDSGVLISCAATISFLLSKQRVE